MDGPGDTWVYPYGGRRSELDWRSLFSKRDHVFQNIGDGTYNHSGIQAIRAAVAANTDITYKILFNDAVAMTGGQGNDGQLSAVRIVNELLAIGIENTVLVYDDKEDLSLSSFPSQIEKVDRTKLNDVQEKLSKIKGVTAIVYVQTCAAEKEEEESEDCSQILIRGFLLIRIFVRAVVIAEFNQTVLPLRLLKLN